MQKSWDNSWELLNFLMVVCFYLFECNPYVRTPNSELHNIVYPASEYTEIVMPSGIFMKAAAASNGFSLYAWQIKSDHGEIDGL